MRRPRFLANPGGVAVLVYLLVLAPMMLEQAGKATDDTRLELIVDPWPFLQRSMSLWNHDATLGELQNQAYGYLFPQGPFFALGHVASLPGWITERLWSYLLVVAACEGARRVALLTGVGRWGALVGGLAYGFAPRMISEVGVRSGEILPTVAAPWILIPVLAALSGRLRPRTAAVLSAAAYALSGGVNGTATVAPLPLVFFVIAWAVLTRRAGWSLLGWWTALIGLSSIWWLTSLLQLNRYSPPFFDYVEGSSTTTSFSGMLEALRGNDNWVSYVTAGTKPWWPAGYDLSYHPFLIAMTGLIGLAGLLGLCFGPPRFRTPLVISAGFGLACLTIGYSSALDSPLAPTVQTLLDGVLAPLRNIHKVDPVLRLPLAVGLAVTVEALLGWRPSLPDRLQPRIGPAAAGVLALIVISCAQPVFAGNLRTPGWTKIPDYWTETAGYLAQHDGPGRAWVVPGSGFAIQQWGWTMEEPMVALARSPWVTRNQVPLAPAETIRMLDQLESTLETGTGSAFLGTMLSRLGIDHIVVRHDLDTEHADTIPSSLVSIALARSTGIRRVATFGQLAFGPAVEVFRVVPRRQPQVQVRDLDDVVTVASSAADVLTAVGYGFVGAAAPTITVGDLGWEHPADIVGDSVRRVERNFGRVHQATSGVMSRQDRFRIDRRVHDYLLEADPVPIMAQYLGFHDVAASSSAGYADGVGAVLPEAAPFAALDGDPATAWWSDGFEQPVGQWLRVTLDSRQPLHKVTVAQPRTDRVYRVTRWQVSAGGQDLVITSDPDTGSATVDFTGARADEITVTALAVADGSAAAGPVGISEVQIQGVSTGRTLTVPGVGAGRATNFMFTAEPETRGCVTTLLGPDCDPSRQRTSEESTGIDRLVSVGSAGRWDLTGVAIARSGPATEILIDPLGGVRAEGSSWLLGDPTISPRMAYDGSPTTSWIAADGDLHPTLHFTLPRPRTFTRLGVGAPASPAHAPSSAVITTPGGQIRRVDLNGFGVFKPLRTGDFTIAFSGPRGVDGPLGMSEVYLTPGKVTVPLVGAAPTGSICGYGPPVEINGHEYKTQVRGVIGDVVSAGPLGFSVCGAKHIRMRPGLNRVRIGSTEQFQPVDVRIAATTPHRATTSSRVARVLSSADTRWRIRVSAGKDALLSSGWNFNAGWVATLGGKTLQPLRVDGWSQGWKVPAGAAGIVEIEYVPQDRYLAGLLGGLGVLAVILVLALVDLIRRPWRHRPATARPQGRPRHGRRVQNTAAAVAIMVGTGSAAWLLGGLPLAVGATVGCAGAVWLPQWSHKLIAAATVVLLVSIAGSVWVVWDGPARPEGWMHWLASMGAGCLLVTAYARSRRLP